MTNMDIEMDINSIRNTWVIDAFSSPSHEYVLYSNGIVLKLYSDNYEPNFDFILLENLRDELNSSKNPSNDLTRLVNAYDSYVRANNPENK